MVVNRFDRFARQLPVHRQQAIGTATAAKVEGRRESLGRAFEDVDAARRQASEVRNYVLDHLGDLLQELEAQCEAHGVRVHWALEAEEARDIIASLCPKGAHIVKAKSMATEEIHLNDFLNERGHHVVETDLGEFVVQIDGDTPSHIVTPIVHKTRQEVAASFEREGLGPRTEDPEELTQQARRHLREEFRRADVGISGVNFAVAESGRLVLVENEGNNRLSTTAPRKHIALMGIEKLLPRDADLALFLRLLAGSGTGQRLTVYTHFIQRARGEGGDGPDEVHLVLLDNGRTKAISGPYRDILKCIRCGACLNVCPVFRQGSGHAYDHVYSGPMGAVLAPALEGVERHPDIAKASSLCGACQEVCPVDIPIPMLLSKLRDEAFRKGLLDDRTPWSGFATVARSPALWQPGRALAPKLMRFTKGWSEFRQPPAREGRDFRRWWRERSREDS